MDPAPPPQGRSRHAISGHHRRHAPGPGAELHEGYGNRTGRNRLPARLLLTGSIPARIQALDRRSTRAISPTDETTKAGLKRVPSRASIRTRHGCSYIRRGVSVPVGAPPTVRTAIEPNLKASPHSHPTRVLLQSISGVEVQCPERDLVLPVGAPPTVRTAIEPNLRASPHSHPTRVLLRWIRGGEVCVGAPPSVRTGQAHIRTRRGCSYNKYANSHPGRVLLQQIREFAPVAGAPTARRSRMPTPHISCASSTASSHSWARCSSSSSSYSFILFSPS